MPDFRQIGPAPVAQITPSADPHELLTDPAAGPPAAGSYHFVDHGGGASIARAASLVLVWFGDDPERAAVEAFAGDLFAAGIASCLSVYGVGLGSFRGSVVVQAIPPATLTFAQVAADVQALITAGMLPASDGQTLYATMLPESVTVDAGGGDDSCAAWCGIHDRFAGVAVSVEPSTTCQGCHSADYTPLQARQAVLFHEFCEFATDMQPGQGVYDNASGSEICDPVAWFPVACGPYVLQPICGPDGSAINPTYTQSQPQPGPQGCRDAALGAADAVVRALAAKHQASPRSTTYRYELAGAQLVRAALAELPS